MIKSLTALLPLLFAVSLARPQNENNDVTYGYAIDINVPTGSSMMSCVKNSNYQVVFVRGFNPAGQGSFDANAATSIRNAYNAGLGIEVYMTPQPMSSVLGYQQMDELYNGLTANGITVRSIWIQVTSPSNWNKEITANLNFINSILARARQYGLTVGVYTNQFDWNQIAGGYKGFGSDILLWYYNVYGPGVTGESQPTFTDFYAFGSFTQPSVKQFAQSETVCQMIVNRDVYAVGIPMEAKEKSGNEKNTIVVGGFVVRFRI